MSPTNFDVKSKTAPLLELVSYINTILETDKFKDSSLNGLQFESNQSEISCIACAVDAGELVIDQAVALGAQLLIVHHGLFWGQSERLTAALGRKINKLSKAGCSLYASHLPLDAHSELGNAAGLGRFIGCTEIQPFFQYQGCMIGARARFAKAIHINELAQKLKVLTEPAIPLVIAAGKVEISTLGLVTGSGSFAIRQCQEAGLDLLLSGEPKHEVFHLAHELKTSAIFAGHYATETFGVKALGAHLEQRFGIKKLFIDLPSGI